MDKGPLGALSQLAWLPAPVSTPEGRVPITVIWALLLSSPGHLYWKKGEGSHPATDKTQQSSLASRERSATRVLMEAPRGTARPGDSCPTTGVGRVALCPGYYTQVTKGIR